MSDTAIVLVAAFGGGLAGAVLQPIVEAGFEAWRGRGQRKKRREQRLRAMLEAQIRYGARILGANTMTVIYRQKELPLPHDHYAAINTASTQLADSGFFWQPDRIEDQQLRALAKDFEANCIALMERGFAKDGISDAEFLRLSPDHSELRRKL